MENIHLRSKQNLKKRSSRDEFQYTRPVMEPILLRQQDGKTKTKGENRIPKKRSDISDAYSRVSGPLNVYDLVNQVGDILYKFPEANATHEIIGRTASYNDIVLFKITKDKEKAAYRRAADSKYVDDVPEKKIVFIVHALTLMGIMRLFSLTREKYLEVLLSYYIKQLDNFDIYLIPMANPDGYNRNKEFRDGLTFFGIWNKNLSPQVGCRGVDLDRNFDVAWNGSQGISTCSQHYPGSAPFSEHETKAVRDVFYKYGHKIVAYFHVHPGSYNKESFKGDAVLYPRGFTDVPLDDDKYLDMKGEIDEAMKNASFKAMSVTVDTLHNWYGQVTGTSVDYASTVYGIPFAVELVMQIYTNPSEVIYSALIDRDSKEDVEYFALTEIWSRILDCVFNSVSKTLVVNE